MRIYRHYSEDRPQLPMYGKTPAFTLVTQNKEQATSEQWNGNVIIADFVFTTCAGPCPMMSAQMQDFQDELKDEAGIKFVSFSVDPETDTPDVLTEYGKRFHADFSRWSFLTGSKSAIYHLTTDGFHLALDSDSNSVTHSTKFVLVDKQSRIRGYYDFDDSTSQSAIMRDAIALEHE
jgi:protein SCO1/2